MGWEKAESEVAALKQQLEVAVQQNLSLEVKTSHLKECLRQARDEQEKRIVMEKSNKWESMRGELEKRILDLQDEEKSAFSDPNAILILEALEENSLLKQEPVSCCRELEVVTIERDLSTQAASRLQNVAKLEGECPRLQSSPLSESCSALISGPNQLSAKNLAVEIDMMDDFLEMERLAGESISR